MGAATRLLQNNSPQEVAGAASDHIQSTDADTVADHLAEGAQGMDQSSLAGLGTSLLGALAKHGHDESAVQDAGVSPDAAASGDQGQVLQLIEHAREHPDALKDAAMQYVQQNPAVLKQLPGLVQGVLGRLGG